MNCCKIYKKTIAELKGYYSATKMSDLLDACLENRHIKYRYQYTVIPDDPSYNYSNIVWDDLISDDGIYTPFDLFNDECVELTGPYNIADLEIYNFIDNSEKNNY